VQPLDADSALPDRPAKEKNPAVVRGEMAEETQS